MIEKTIIDYLMGKTSAGNNVFAEVPVTPPDEYILIERTGGNRTDHIEHAMIAVQSISNASLLRAMTINEEVKDAMEDLYAYTAVFGCELNSNYNFTNTQTKEYRYQAVFNVHY